MHPPRKLDHSIGILWLISSFLSQSWLIDIPLFTPTLLKTALYCWLARVAEGDGPRH